MTKAQKPPRVRKSSGNVFADLGLPEPEEALAKAKLASRICQVITERGLTQKAAARILSLDQPKISALLRGKLTGFSMNRLFRFLNDLGQAVEIIIRPSKRGSKGELVVAAAK